MFSGIIDHCGTIIELTKQAHQTRAIIQTQFKAIQPGESIAVDGTCLTAVEPQDGRFTCDISPETLKLTTAEQFSLGQKVNLERALAVGDRLGGHWVMGHIDQQANIQKIEPQGDFFAYTLAGFLPEVMPYLVKKGSIAINGVSLTINKTFADAVEVMLIPHTLERTNLNSLSIGNLVNIEFDAMARTIVNYLQSTYKNI